MSFLHRLRVPQMRSGPLGGGGWAVGNMAAPPIGAIRGTDGAMQIAAFWACVRIVADAVSMNPIYTYTWVNGVKTRAPTPLIDDQPFVGVETWSGVHQTVYSMLLYGNAYWYVARDNNGRPTGLYVIDPNMVRLRRDDQGIIWAEVQGKPFLLGDEIMHIPLMSVPGRLEGLSPIEYWESTIDTAKSVDSFGRAFFKNGSTTSGVLTTEVALTDDEARSLAAQWRATHSGVGRAFLPAVLPESVKWSPTTIPNDQAQLLQTRQYARSEIAMMIGVPPHMIGDVDRTTSWGTGIEQQTMGFMRWTMRGYSKRIEDAFSRLLPAPSFACFDFDDMLRTDTAGRYAAYMIARTIGSMSVNDVRAKENQPPIAGDVGDDYTLPLNSSPNDVDPQGPPPPLPPTSDGSSDAGPPDANPAL